MKTSNLLRTLFATALALCVGFLSPFEAKAQTDVTSLYLKNADFSTGWTTSDVGNGNVKEVTGWTGTSSGTDWFYGGAISYAGGVKVNSSTVSSNPSGTTTGGALGISAGWGCTVRYTQVVTFPAGKYRISYKAYNANTDARQVYNYIGFVETGGTEHYGYINNFIPSTWMEDEIILNFTSATSGNISVGIGAVDGGSGANAKLFVDYIKIEAYNPAVSNMVGAEVTPGSWTGNTGTYSSTYPEYYNGSHFTGDAMTSTTTVDNGNYDAYVYFHSHKAWISQAAEDGTLNSYINANDVTRSVGIVNNNGFASYEPTLYHLSDIPVTSGSLVIKVGNSAQGGNWLTVKTEKIVKKTAATISYGSANFPIDDATSVTADYWYAYTVPMGGDYTITSSAATTVYYSQDGTQAASGGTYTSLGLSAATASDPISLSAGTLYIKASAATTLTIAAASYSYNVGSATVSHNYVQGGETVTVTYPDAATNNPSAPLTISTSGVKFNGSTPADLTATANGFTFTVPSGLSAATNYTLAIPANIVGYAVGTYNAAQNITLKAPALLDGTYFFKTDADKFLLRGEPYGSAVQVYDWGMPVKVTTDATATTLQFADASDWKIFSDGTGIYADNASPTYGTWHMTVADGKYKFQNAVNNHYMKVDGTRVLSTATAGEATAFTMVTPAGHQTVLTNYVNAQATTAASEASLSAATPAALETVVGSMSSYAFIEGATSATTQEKYQGGQWDSRTVYSNTFNVPVAGLYKFTIQAFYRMTDNATTYALHTANADCPPVYVFFGDAKTPIKSVMDENNTTNYGNNCVTYGGNYYPNGQTGAKAAFQDDKYINTVWVYISTPGEYTYGIQYLGWAGSHSEWTCYTTESISLTYYYTGNSDFVKDGVHKYIGTYAMAPALEVTDAVPVVDVTGATFTSGSSAVTFTNPNGLVFVKTDGQTSAAKNEVIGTTCASLQLEKGHPFINPKEFTATAAKYTLSAGELAGGFGTLMIPFAASTLAGTAYTLDQGVDLIDGNIRGTSAASIAANSPVLVTASGNYTGSSVAVPVVAAGATYTNGELVGTYTAMTAVEGSYVLQNHTSGEGVAFYLVGSTKPTVNPFRAYIKAQNAGVKALRVILDGDTDAISTIEATSDASIADIYGTDGMRRSQLQKGINIIRMSNGKVKKANVK